MVESVFCPRCGKQIMSVAKYTGDNKKIGEETSLEIMNVDERIKEECENKIGKTEENGNSASLGKDKAENQNDYMIHKTSKNEQEKSEEKENEAVKVNLDTEEKKKIQIDNFSVKDLFLQVFKKHTSKERDEILKAGIVTNEKREITPQSFQPWLYSRVFLILFTVFITFEIGLLYFGNSNLMPAVMLIGALVIPFSLLTMYFELNIYRDISFYRVIGIFLLGGAISLLFTLVLYAVFPSGENFSILGASLVSVIEEIGKVFIVIFILNRNKNSTVLHGLLIGGAIGCGFAVFESAGYAFNVFLNVHDYNTRAGMINDYLPWYLQYSYEDSIAAMNVNILLRSLLSFGGHTAWAAIEGSAYAKEKKVNLEFLKMFAVCFVLHAIWDVDTPLAYLKLLVLCFVAWGIIIWQIKQYLKVTSF